LTERYVGPYEIEEIVLNIVRLKLPVLMRIHLVVNISKVVRYRKSVKGQRVENQ